MPRVSQSTTKIPELCAIPAGYKHSAALRTERRFVNEDRVLRRLAGLMNTGPVCLLLAAGAAALVCYAVPRGADAYRVLSRAGDPAAISAHALSTQFDADRARAEIEAALAVDDADLAKSFADLAAGRHVVLDPALTARVDAAVAEASSTRQRLKNFAAGFVTGQPTDGAGLAGTAVGDLFVFGDIRDAAREGTRFARGEPHDNLVLGLACVGLAVTAGTYATVGLSAPARFGLTLEVDASERNALEWLSGIA